MSDGGCQFVAEYLVRAGQQGMMASSSGIETNTAIPISRAFERLLDEAAERARMINDPKTRPRLENGWYEPAGEPIACHLGRMPYAVSAVDQLAVQHQQHGLRKECGQRVIDVPAIRSGADGKHVPYAQRGDRAGHKPRVRTLAHARPVERGDERKA